LYVRPHPLCPFTTLFRSDAAEVAEAPAEARDAPHIPGVGDADEHRVRVHGRDLAEHGAGGDEGDAEPEQGRGGFDEPQAEHAQEDRKSTRLNSSHVKISY